MNDPRITLAQQEPYRSMPFHVAWIAVTAVVQGRTALRFWAEADEPKHGWFYANGGWNKT